MITRETSEKYLKAYQLATLYCPESNAFFMGKWWAEPNCNNEFSYFRSWESHKRGPIACLRGYIFYGNMTAMNSNQVLICRWEAGCGRCSSYISTFPVCTVARPPRRRTSTWRVPSLTCWWPQRAVSSSRLHPGNQPSTNNLFCHLGTVGARQIIFTQYEK